MEKLLQSIPPQQIIPVVLVLVAIALLMLRIAPTAYKWFDCLRNHINDYENINNLVKQHSLQIEQINQELDKNKSYHQHIKAIIEKQQAMMEDSIAEREIMLKGILTIIKSLNEPEKHNAETRKIEQDIKDFLISKCHQSID